MSKQPDLKATILDEFREKFPTLQVETIEELLPAIETIQKYPEQIEAFLSTAIDRVREEALEEFSCHSCPGLGGCAICLHVEEKAGFTNLK